MSYSRCYCALLLGCAALTAAQESTAGAGTPPHKSAVGAKPPDLQAVGVRGLIDPGGYSASASAASAPRMLGGMADIERRQNNAFEKSWPCDLEQPLKKSAEESKSAEALRNLGEFYLAHGQFRQSYPPLQLAAQKRAEPQTLRLLAQAYEGSAQFAEAARAYEAAAALLPGEDDFFAAGYEWILSGSPESATREFREALQRYPRSFKLAIGNGVADFLAGNTDEAIQSFLLATGLRPADPAGYEALASALAGHPQSTPRIEQAFRQFAEVSPRNANAQYLYALSLKRQGNENPAIETSLRRAITLDPGFAEAHLELAHWYAGKKDSGNEITEYEEAVRAAPALAFARYRLAMAYQSAGEHEKAQEEFDAYRALNKGTQQEGNADPDVKRFISVFSTAGAEPHKTAPCEAGGR